MLLDISYAPHLVVASILIAAQAAFTAFRISEWSQGWSIVRQRIQACVAALVLGIGIWSMHFIGSLALHFDVVVSYDPVFTVLSATVSIIVMQVAMLILLASNGQVLWINLAGLVAGLGIVATHYLGMAAMSENCIPRYTTLGVVIPIVIAVGVSTLALHLVSNDNLRIVKDARTLGHRFLDERGLVFLIFGAITFGSAISMMHYAAVAFTEFEIITDLALDHSLLVSSTDLVIYVTLSSSIIIWLFLFATGPMKQDDVRRLNCAPTSPALVPGQMSAAIGGRIAGPPSQSGQTADHHNARASFETFDGPLNGQASSRLRIPVELRDTTEFIDPQSLISVSATGHYTHLTDNTGEKLCSWSISHLERVLAPYGFIRTHRSYLVNKAKIVGFQKDGTKSFCIVDAQLRQKVPVSRTHIQKIKRLLNLS